MMTFAEEGVLISFLSVQSDTFVVLYNTQVIYNLKYANLCKFICEC